MPKSSIGARIRELREGVFDQQELATRAGISVDLIRKLEQGRRHTASIKSLHAIAQALDVDTADLLEKAAPVPSGDPEEGVVALRRVLTSVDDLIDPSPGEDAPSVADTQRAVDYAWGCYWSGRYEVLAQMLPNALISARATFRDCRSDRRPRAAELLAELYQVAGCTLVHLGQSDSAWMAVREALAVAEHGDDPLRPSTLRGSLSWLLLVQGRYDEAHQVAVRSASGIEPAGDVAVQHLSVWGSLLLGGATAAGRAGRGSTATELLDAAREAADRLGADRNDYELAFGPSQVTMQTVDVHVVTEHYGQALTAAKRMSRDAALPLAARCRHLADVAFAQTKTGRDERALNTLLTMESMAPAWIKYQTLPRQVTRELLEREQRRARNTRLRELATRLGVNQVRA